MPVPTQPFLHPTAVVDLPVQIGAGTAIWHFCHVTSGAVIGSDCVLGQNVYVAGTVRIGDRCRIQNNVSLYDGVRLQDEVFVGPSAVFTNVLFPRAFVCRRSEYQTTWVERGATIGANSTILAGNRLGRYCFVAAGAVVTENVPPFALVVGVPARQAGWMSRHGARLEFDPSTRHAQCPQTGEEYCLDENGVRCLGPDAPLPERPAPPEPQRLSSSPPCS